MGRPKVVVVGYGYAGRSFHSYLVKLTGGLELYGVAVRNPEARARAAAEHGCRTYESFEQALEDPAVDLVVLATPSGTHAEMAIAAMDAGKHVVTDKPMCLTVAEADRMIEASRRTGKLLSVFHNRRWDGDYLTLRKLVDEGRLGQLRWIETAWQRFYAPRGWRGQRQAGGGRIYDLGSHLIDQMLLLIGQPATHVYCRMHREFPGADVESSAMVTIGCAGGATAICDVSTMTRIQKPRYYAVGTDATFVKDGYDPQEAAMNAGNIDAAVEKEEEYGRLHDGKTQTVIPTVRGRWRSFYENIADALSGAAPPAVELEQMRQLIAVLEAAHCSADSGQVIAV